MLPLVLVTSVPPLSPPNASSGLCLRQAAIDMAHGHPTVVVTRPTAGRPGLLRVMICQSAGLVVVVPDHFSTLASC